MYWPFTMCTVRYKQQIMIRAPSFSRLVVRLPRTRVPECAIARAASTVGMVWWNIIGLWQARFSRHGSVGPPPCRQAALIPNGAAQKNGKSVCTGPPVF